MKVSQEARWTGRPTDGRVSRLDFLPSANRPIEIHYPGLVRGEAGASECPKALDTAERLDMDVEAGATYEGQRCAREGYSFVQVGSVTGCP